MTTICNSLNAYKFVQIPTSFGFSFVQALQYFHWGHPVGFRNSPLLILPEAKVFSKIASFSSSIADPDYKIPWNRKSWKKFLELHRTQEDSSFLPRLSVQSNGSAAFNVADKFSIKSVTSLNKMITILWRTNWPPSFLRRFW